jgi:hypothetical protein
MTGYASTAVVAGVMLKANNALHLANDVAKWAAEARRLSSEFGTTWGTVRVHYTTSELIEAAAQRATCEAAVAAGLAAGLGAYVDHVRETDDAAFVAIDRVLALVKAIHESAAAANAALCEVEDRLEQSAAERAARAAS